MLAAALVKTAAPVHERDVPASQTGIEGISCLTCSAKSSGLKKESEAVSNNFAKKFQH